ncbi:radical SAM protein [Thermospira aquatica]|uniref:Radical SAM protein n=1 Tax=Thermospira aquatica TaxID=2828656 RepID=A0AAX3BBA7_9SPIR|nr:radical SAM protein [Thermospira aquatica]URA09587.1 radical SAM protein [Thermospira aquatica]
MGYKHIYGPVPSRRLGISLGVDLFETKTCNFNCVYCECGRNARYVYERGHFVPPEEILKEIEDFLASNPAPQSITFSGTGEPTLSLDIGFLLETLSRRYPSIRLTVLTNGSLLWDPEVQHDLLPASLVVPSLDAVTEEAYQKIDRPHKIFELEKVIQGIIEFSQKFHTEEKKEIWLEVFIVPGVNDDPSHTRRLATLIQQMKCDRVQLNSLDRPPAEAWVKPAPESVLHGIREALREKGVIVPIDIVKRYTVRSELSRYHQDVEVAILEAVARRPMRLDDLSVMLGRNSEEIMAYLDILQREGKIQPVIQDHEIFYRRR